MKVVMCKKTHKFIRFIYVKWTKADNSMKQRLISGFLMKEEKEKTSESVCWIHVWIMKKAQRNGKTQAPELGRLLSGGEHLLIL